jgi:glutathione peroxidase
MDTNYWITSAPLLSSLDQKAVREKEPPMNLYDIKVKDKQKNEVSLSEYKGKVLLIVNTATGCGFTPQYAGLEKLYETYKDQGFVVLDFPSNQFMNQAPGSDEEITNFCTANYGISYPQFSKVDVNGKSADNLFVFIKSAVKSGKEPEEGGKFARIIGDLKDTVLGNDIKWNFTKFLVDREGNVVNRYAPNVKPEDLAPDIEALLKA